MPSALHLACPTDSPTATDTAIERLLTLLLPADEGRVLRLRTGMDGPACSLVATARRLRLSVSATRRLEIRALRRLRRHALQVATDDETAHLTPTEKD